MPFNDSSFAARDGDLAELVGLRHKHFILTLNCKIVTYNKTTGVADGVLDTTPNAFFNSVRNGIVVSDPHIRYDRTSGRWFIVIINVAFPNNRILLAVSDTAIITGVPSGPSSPSRTRWAGMPTAWAIIPPRASTPTPFTWGSMSFAGQPWAALNSSNRTVL